MGWTVWFGMLQVVSLLGHHPIEGLDSACTEHVRFRLSIKFIRYKESQSIVHGGVTSWVI